MSGGFDGVILDDEIKRAYSIHKFSVIFKREAECLGENEKSVFLELKDGNGSDVLEHCCIHNVYKKIDKKIVELKNIRLKEGRKNRRLGKKILHKNIEVYRENGFKKIVLFAIKDGIIAWRKMGFEFDSAFDEARVVKKIKEYLIEVKRMKVDDIRGISSIKEVDKSLLFDDKINFTDWAFQNDVLQHLAMTLRI